jgi:hypothetical protein
VVEDEVMLADDENFNFGFVWLCDFILSGN